MVSWRVDYQRREAVLPIVLTARSSHVEGEVLWSFMLIDSGSEIIEGLPVLDCCCWPVITGTELSCSEDRDWFLGGRGAGCKCGQPKESTSWGGVRGRRAPNGFLNGRSLLGEEDGQEWAEYSLGCE